MKQEQQGWVPPSLRCTLIWGEHDILLKCYHMKELGLGGWRTTQLLWVKYWSCSTEVDVIRSWTLSESVLPKPPLGPFGCRKTWQSWNGGEWRKFCWYSLRRRLWYHKLTLTGTHRQTLLWKVELNSGFWDRMGKHMTSSNIEITLPLCRRLNHNPCDYQPWPKIPGKQLRRFHVTIPA